MVAKASRAREPMLCHYTAKHRFPSKKVVAKLRVRVSSSAPLSPYSEAATSPHLCGGLRFHCVLILLADRVAAPTAPVFDPLIEGGQWLASGDNGDGTVDEQLV